MEKSLAFRMRPTTIDEVVGHKKLFDENGIIRKLVQEKKIINFVLSGNPGLGKTTIARAFASSINANCYLINAVNTTKQEMLEVFKMAQNNYPSIVIIDEIHQLDKAKQSILLPLLEDNLFYVIGTTTTNPYLTLNNALRSRLHIFSLDPLTDDNIKEAILRSVTSPKGLNNEYSIEKDVIDFIVKKSSGDLRYAYSLLELISINVQTKDIRLKDIDPTIIDSNYLSDQNENEHYDTLSAFQKSIRGSDVDAALYYLAKLLTGGDIEGILRRLIVIAYEDISFGNPQAVSRTIQAVQSFREIGLPEGRIILSFAVIDLALSPKSKVAENSIDKAIQTYKNKPLEVKECLKYLYKNSDKEKMYSYELPKSWPLINYLPDEKANMTFFESENSSSYEKALFENYCKLKENRLVDLKEVYKKIKG